MSTSWRNDQKELNQGCRPPNSGEFSTFPSSFFYFLRIEFPLHFLTWQPTERGREGEGGGEIEKVEQEGRGFSDTEAVNRTSSFPGCFSSLFCLFLLLSCQGRHTLAWAALPPRSHFEPLQERPLKHVHVLHGATTTPVPLLNGSSFLAFPTFFIYHRRLSHCLLWWEIKLPLPRALIHMRNWYLFSPLRNWTTEWMLHCWNPPPVFL